MDQEVLEILKGINANLTALTGQKVGKEISGTPDAQLIFGAAGLFSNFGLDSTVINAGLYPRGIDRYLPVFPTVYTDPVYSLITGIEPDGEDEPDGVCDDAPGAVLETCHQVAAFGRYTRSSKEMEVNQLMQVLNGHLTTDIKVLGSILGPGHALLTGQGPADNGTWIRSVIETQMMLVKVELQRKLTQQLWQGDPANNSANGGYLEFPGLDILIATGKVDAFTNVACGALDPDVKDFDYNDIAGDDPSIVAYLSMMMYYLEHNAERMGLDPVTWRIAMRPQMFFELTRIWPAHYLTAGAIVNNVNTVVMSSEAVQMRDAMWNGRWLIINGRQYEVITDDGIFEHNSTNNANLDPGEFASDIYILPFTAKGMPVLYWEHLDYTQAMADVSAYTQNKGQFWSTDAGRYMWTLQNLNYCFKIQSKLEPRVILRTPQLAGRLQHVMYQPLQHLREPFSESPYFVKGGNEEYSTPPSYYNEWDQR